MRAKKGYGRHIKNQGRSPVYFEIRLLDGGLEKIPKNCLRSFMAINKQKVHSYAPCEL